MLACKLPRCATFSPKSVGAAPRSRTRVHVVRAQGINQNIRKEEQKVVDFVNAEEIKGKKVMCRCWKSGTFPECDGAHAKHNKETGDNVGPLIIEKKE
uniref:Zinc finger cdgsh domain-containing protein 1 n=1 Tax=Tetraselmis sp. GSL018 TaxID=582737 RepID=A0A061SDL2_9CHLO|mmetsp:Transcript_5476/g.13372  ORF Transcript_5476/g.13372 Transcript_5476/m.13372 type:complete len:98 (+) Transcript_5476:75-368(+)